MAESEVDRLEATKPPATSSPIAEEDDGGIDVVGLLRKLLREKKTILIVTLSAFASATTVAFLLPFTYTSTVSFIPPPVSGSSSMASMGDLFGSGKGPGDLYVGILMSRSIASELVRRFDLMHVYGVKKESQAEKILSASTAANVDIKSTIVTLQVIDKSPSGAHDLANGYLEALRETQGRLALSQSAQRRLFFGQQLEKEKNDLEDAEVELERTEESSGLIAPTGQTEAEIRTIAETQAAVAVREVQLAALRDSATDQNPEVIRLRSEIGDLQGQLARLQSGGRKTSITAIPTAEVPELQLEYVRKEREVKYHEALFEMLSRQYESARLDEAREAPVLQVIDAATYPDAKTAPKRSYYMLGGLVFGFFASCLWVLTRDTLRAIRPFLASS